MGISIQVVKDTATESLRKYAAEDASRKRELVAAVAVDLQSYTVQSFTDRSKRESPWPNKVDGTEATLIGAPKLRPSIRVFSITDDSAVVGTDAIYAAVHQDGSKKRNIRRRPYFPFTAKGELFAPFSDRIDKLIQAAINF